MADAIVSFAVETIGNLLIEEGKFLQGVGEQVRLLHDDLGRIERFLKYADTKQSARESVQPWIKEFRAIAYEASDLVEDYAFKFSSQRQQVCTNTLKRYACIFRGCYGRHKLGKEIQSLRSRITDLTKNFGEFDVAATMMQEEGSSSSTQRQLRRTYSFVADPDFIALDGDVELLVKYLMNENEDGQHQRHSVVSIFGMGGLGKTTLARKVYHHPKLKQYFSGFAWICVSQQWQTKDVLQGILRKFAGDEDRSKSEDFLAERLHQVLTQRRCLIVLDDIWTREAWDCIKHAVPIAGEGSKILITTRIESVAVQIGPNGYHHKPRLLNEQESWKLLQKKSLRENTDCEDFSKLEELGKKMMKYCGGLPLAVVVLGGILSTKKGLNEWISVHENIRSLLEKGEIIGQAEGEVPKILALSYYDLPYQLKPCFVYLGKFKEDSEIEAEMLYQLWIAEGMVFQSDRMGQETMMEVAERYLEELANRCMVQVQMHKEYEAAITKFKSCRLHDLMRDVCLIKAKEEGLYKVIEFGEGDHEATATSDDHVVDSSLERHYRLAIRLSKLDDSKHVHLPRKEQTRHLRSFTYKGVAEEMGNLWKHEQSIIKFKKFKRLRVLAIEGQKIYDRRCCCFFIRCEFSCMLRRAISKLIHLRYLSLRGFDIRLSNLQHLETLDLRGATTVRIPNNVLQKMGNLTHLYLPNTNQVIKQWCKLRFDGLSKLETLDGFHNNFCDCKSLSKLINLRALRADVFAIDIEKLEQFINSISNMKHLRMCKLDIWILLSSSENEKLVVVEQLLWCGYIQKLDITGHLLNKLPPVPPPSSNISPGPGGLGLRWLTLYDSKIVEDPMGTLEKLPNLRRLDLDWNSYLGKEIICHSTGFPQLRVLELRELPNLEKWKVDEGAMPKLTSLEIKSCKKLEMIPDGLRCLKELTLINMPEEFNSRVRRVNNNGEELEQGQDFHKISHIPSIVIKLKE